VPKFVETAKKPFAIWFLRINSAGDAATIKIENISINKADLTGFLDKTQITIPTKPDNNNLGWKKEINPIVIEARITFLLKTLSEFEVKSWITNPKVTNNPDAAKLSYPIEIDVSDKVGFKSINNITKKE
jgi:hypothetical protein